jgi:hypothetical protein
MDINKDMLSRTKSISNNLNVNLRKDNDGKTYYLNFSIKNPHLNANTFLETVNIYKLLQQVNSHIIEDISIKVMDESVYSKKYEILYYFSSLSHDMGINKRYMFINTSEEWDLKNNRIIYKSKSIDYPDKDKNPRLKLYDLLTNHCLDIQLDIITSSEINVNIKFNLDIHEDLPIYMNNLVGVMMTKMFYNLKTFIEKIQ